MSGDGVAHNNVTVHEMSDDTGENKREQEMKVAAMEAAACLAQAVGGNYKDAMDAWHYMPHVLKTLNGDVRVHADDGDEE